MGLGDTFKKLVGIEDVEDDFTEEDIAAAKAQLAKEETRRPVSSFQPKPAGTENNKAVPISQKISIAGTSAFKLVVIEPKSFDECPIIINLEKIETETAKKIFDFLSGATYALNGNVQKVANNIFIFAPESVDIAAGQDDRSAFDFGGANKNPWK